MRPTISAARDVSRLCSRCCLRARHASSLTGSSLSRPTTLRTAPSATSLPRHLPPTTQNHPFSTTSPSSKPSPRQTHYDLFPSTLPSGPPPSGTFPIDTRALRREFLQLQARAHPDMHPQEHKPRAEAASALINDAYRTLANPLLRAQYLLSLRGVDVANDETLKIEEPDLLMLVLEAREEIEEAECEEDLEGPRGVNEGRIAASEEVLERAFCQDDIEAAKREAVRLRYWVNIKDSLDAWEAGKPVVLQH